MKKFNLLIFIFITFFSCTIIANADYKASAKTEGASCNLFVGSTGKCIYANENLNSYLPHVVWLDNGDEVTVLTDAKTIVTKDPNLCSDYYVKVRYAFPTAPNVTYDGYFCNANLLQTSSLLTEELKKEFTEAGFPESYFEKLAILKSIHPNWVFKAINTDLDFNQVVEAESAVGKSLIQDSVNGNQGYLSTMGGSYSYYTDMFNVFDGSNWRAANSQTVAYYIDPRNFLIDMYVFQFEALTYDEENQKIETIHNIFNGDYLYQFSEDFMTAAKESGVSPVYLASLSKQEVSSGTLAPTTAVSGTTFVYNGVTYSNLYNFYNIGATSGSDAVFKGLFWASGLGGQVTHNRPWNNPSTAIIGGALWISEAYISQGQNTSYFKKWNVVYNYLKNNNLVASPYQNYTHQYMTNIMAPTSEARTTYNAYYNSGIIDSSFVFYIPVYKNMPNETTLPATGNPNNYLSSLTVNGNSVNGFAGGNESYTYYVDYETSSVTISGKTVNANAIVEGFKKVNLNVGDNKFNIVVTAQNGSKKTYSINVVRDKAKNNELTVDEIVNQLGVKSDGKNFSGIALSTNSSVIINKIKSLNPNSNSYVTDCNGKKKEGVLSTGDIVNITSNGENKTYSIIIRGDVNGDGSINILDLLRVQKYLLQSVNLNGAYIIAADTNKDNSVSIIDLLKIQKYILGSSTIEQ